MSCWWLRGSQRTRSFPACHESRAWLGGTVLVASALVWASPAGAAADGHVALPDKHQTASRYYSSRYSEAFNHDVELARRLRLQHLTILHDPHGRHRLRPMVRSNLLAENRESFEHQLRRPGSWRQYQRAKAALRRGKKRLYQLFSEGRVADFVDAEDVPHVTGYEDSLVQLGAYPPGIFLSKELGQDGSAYSLGVARNSRYRPEVVYSVPFLSMLNPSCDAHDRLAAYLVLHPWLWHQKNKELIETRPKKLEDLSTHMDVQELMDHAGETFRALRRFRRRSGHIKERILGADAADVAEWHTDLFRQSARDEPTSSQAIDDRFYRARRYITWLNSHPLNGLPTENTPAMYLWTTPADAELGALADPRDVRHPDPLAEEFNDIISGYGALGEFDRLAEAVQWMKVIPSLRARLGDGARAVQATMAIHRTLLRHGPHDELADVQEDLLDRRYPAHRKSDAVPIEPAEQALFLNETSAGGFMDLRAMYFQTFVQQAERTADQSDREELGRVANETLSRDAVMRRKFAEVSTTVSGNGSARQVVAAKNPSPGAPNVILISNQPNSAEAVRYLIARRNWKMSVRHARTLEEALELADEHPPTTFAVDIVMPGKQSGFEHMEALRKHPATEDVPVILIGHHDDPKMESQAYDRGAAAYVPQSETRSLLNEMQNSSREFALGELERAQREKLVNEIRKLLPEPFDEGDIVADHRFIASARLGGDSLWYSWIDPATKQKLRFGVLDFSGHDSSAAMFSHNAMFMLRNRLPYGTDYEDPREVLEAFNRFYHEGLEDDRYFSGCYGVIDLPRNELVYASAGHAPPIRIRDGVAGPLLHRGSALLSTLEHPKYKNIVTDFRPGDELVAYTDGIKEVDHHETGDEQTWEELHEALAQGGPEGRLDRLLDHIRAFQRNDKFMDDITVTHIVRRK